MKRIYPYILCAALFYTLSFVGIGVWFWYHTSDANVSAVFFIFEPQDGEQQPFEPYISRDGTYGQVSDFFNFRESNLYKRVKETRKSEIYRSPHLNYEGKRIYTYCKPFYQEGEFAGVFCMDVPIHVAWFVVIGLVLLIGIAVFIFCSYKIYQQVRLMTLRDAQRDEQLRLAADLQQQILPITMPQHPAVDISAFYQPAQNIGGDLYDVRLGEDNTLTFCIGDISGHGMPAALLMAQVIGIFRTTHGTPDHIMCTINSVLAHDNPDMQFCTMFIGQLHLDSGVLVFCNAGHPVPELHHLASDLLPSPLQDKLEGTIFPPLGISATVHYTSQTTVLPMGVTLSLFTDGVYEDEEDDISRLNIQWKPRLENLHPWLLAQGVEDNMTELALEEALVNVLHYAEASSVSLIPTETDGATPSFLLVDNGRQFDPTKAISQSDGVGLKLIRELAAPTYRRKKNINCLTLTFAK